MCSAAPPTACERLPNVPMPCFTTAGVAVKDRHVLDGHAKLVGKHLSERRLVALAVRRRTGCGADPAITLDCDLSMLPATGGQCRRRADAADLHVHRETETDEPSLCLCRIALLLEVVPLRVHQRRVERLCVVAGVVHRTHLRLERELVRRDEVLAANVSRIHVELARQHVHRALDEVGRFRPSRTAVGVGRCLVREDFRQRRADGGDVVGRVRHQHRQRRDRGREQHVVGADVGDEPHLEAEHRAVALRCQLDVAEDVATVRGRHKRLGAILDPLDRYPELLGHGGRHVLFGVDVDLGAEAATDFRSDRADLILAHAEHRGDHRAQDVRVLRRRPDRHRALAGLEMRDDAARLHRVWHETLIEHPLLDDHLGLCEGAIDGRVIDRLSRQGSRRFRSARGQRQGCSETLRG